MVVLILPNAQRVVLDVNSTYYASNNTLIINGANGQARYESISTAGAANMATQIDAAVAAPNTAVAIVDNGALTFSGIVPNTFSSGVGYPGGVLSGTAFTGLVPLSLFLDNGAGSVGVGGQGIANDTTINIFYFFFSVAPPPGVYTLYYSLDAGATQVSTGLTVTVTP